MQPSHFWGSDLEIGPTGDLAVVEGPAEGQQRVLRRLLTASRELLFHPDYGAGLPAWVGETMRIAEIKSLILSQMMSEAMVADSPAPVVILTPSSTSLFCRIQFVDAFTSRNEILAFEVT